MTNQDVCFTLAGLAGVVLSFGIYYLVLLFALGEIKIDWRRTFSKSYREKKRKESDDFMGDWNGDLGPGEGDD